MATDDGMEYACKPVDYSKEIQKLILENPDKWSQAVDEPAKLNWFVGQVMKNTGGKANPIFVIELLKIAADVVKKLR